MLDPSTPARGYCHTYFANTTTDLSSLSLFPSSSDIANIALQAMQEADSLINICGIHLMRLRYKVTPVLLQSIGSWYEDDDSDAEDLEDQSLCEALILEELIVQGEDEDVSRSQEEEDQILGLTGSVIALAVDDFGKVQSLLSETDVDQELDLAKEQRYAQAHRHPKLPDVRVPSELSKLLSLGSLQQKSISFSELINLRRSHQTEHAARSVRIRTNPPTTISTEESLRRKLIRRFHEALRLKDEQGLTTGAARHIRWLEGSSTTSTTPKTGNAANAAIVADNLRNKALQRRAGLFLNAKVPRINDLTSARVSSTTTIQVGSFGFAVTDLAVMLCRVTAIYSKAGGKNGKHCTILESSNIAAVSNIGLQVYERTYSMIFSPITETTVAWQTDHFIFIPSLAFLQLLHNEPTASKAASPGCLEISQQDLDTFLHLGREFTSIKNAMIVSRKREGAGKK